MTTENACDEMKADIREWFSAGEPLVGWTAAIGAEAMRRAFKAGWRTNAVGVETHPACYLDNCEQSDWEEYQRVGLDTYVATLSQPVAAPQAPQAEMADDKCRKVLEAIKQEGMRNHNTRCRDWWPAVVEALQPEKTK